MSIKIIVHYAMEPDTPQLPTGDIVELYKTCGVTLDFEEAVERVNDPKTREGYEELAAELAPPPLPQPGAPAHLIIGREWYDEGAGSISGLLVTRNRGVAAVLTGSNEIGYTAGAAMVQSAAHEIGHMLNLVHAHAIESYTTTMRSGYERYGTVDDAWRQHETKYNEARPGSIDVYPLSGESRLQLTDPESLLVLPWGDPFRDPMTLSSTGDVSVRFLPADGPLLVGGHLPFELQVSHEGTEPVDMAADIGVEFGSLRLRVTRPDGGSYVHRPRVLLCSSDRERLPPGQERVAQGVVMDGPGATVFPTPGTYRIEAELSGIAAPVGSAEVEVREDPVLGPYDLEFSRFLADGAPPARRGHMRKLVILIGSKLEPGLRSHLALLRARRLKNLRQVRELLDAVETAPAPRAVRHAAAMLRVRTCRRGAQARDEARRQLDMNPDHVADAPLHRTLNRLIIKE